MKKRPLWQLLLGDVLLCGVLLLAFAFFHHGYDWLKLQMRPAPQVSVPTTEATLPPETTETPTEAPTEAPTEPDTRTEWQKKFADHFTDEVVVTDHSYSSPNVSITIDAVVDEETPCRYYVADIYVGSLDCFRTYLANDTFGTYETENVVDMDLASDAILAMTGDFYSYQYSGVMVRNGVQYRNDYSGSDLCVLYADGRMETILGGSYDTGSVLEDDIWQLWHFGPALLTADGELPYDYNVSTTVSYINPRSSVGYYEPGHYCFVVVDGRQDGWSRGMTLPQLSQLYYDLGCKAAYNLDGGGSAVMTFQDAIISRQSNGDRELGDILLIAEPREKGQ